MDNVPTFDQGCSATVDLVKTAISHVRDLLVVANEIAPTAAQADRTIDDQQSEVIAQATLALRAFEEGVMRLSKAAHTFLADDSFFSMPAPSAGQGGSAPVTPSTDEQAGGVSPDANGSADASGSEGQDTPVPPAPGA